MRPYELVVLLHPDLEIDVDAPIAKIEKLVTDSGGQVIKRDNWGKKRLAYKIKGQSFAVYIYFETMLDPTKVRGVENAILITEEVLRHLLVSRLEEVDSKPKAKSNQSKPAAVGADQESEES